MLTRWISEVSVLCVFSLASVATTSVAQTGPGGVGTSAANPLWLKADAGTSTTTNGAALSAWTDQSGNANNAAQATPALQPLYKTNVINGMPAIQFDNTAGANADVLIIPDNNNLDNTSGLTIFAITQPNTLDGAARVIVSKRVNVGNQESYMVFFLTSDKLNFDIDGNGDRFATATTFVANTNYLIGMVYDGTLAAASRVRVFVNETLDNASARSESSNTIPNYASDITIGLTNVADGRPYGGHIAELIIYRTALNVAERLVVSNYLSAKYNVSILAASDKYAGDLAVNGDYDFEVAGVGNDASGSNLSASSAITGGLAIAQSAGFQNNDYLIYGHQSGANTLSGDVGGMTGTNNARWSRIWYVDITNAGASQVLDLTFDMSDSGNPITPTVASNYVLLYRAGQSGNWTELTTASSITGDRIAFTGVTLTNDGYYTIGTRNNANSPLPIQLKSFAARVMEKGVELTWQTETELDNDYFTVERSSEGIQFETAIKVQGAGTSTDSKEYTAVDYNVRQGTSYYRLKQTDKDGASSYSAIVAVEIMEAHHPYTVYPNPASEVVHISFRAGEAPDGLRILDVMGSSVQFEYVADEKGIRIPTSDFKPGMYLIQIIHGLTTTTARVVVK
ncbi:MAG TPA: T9SS type A sorting domain-containing protein [Cyclobacteriaceae bacterium]|nr:T9SS type A sorting domain-containing protein [Cyclobacteriaceae bacterium]